MKNIAKNPKISVEAGVFKLEGVPALDIAQRFGTPCFVFLENKIRMNCQKLQKELRPFLPGLSLFYSVKSNYLPPILRTIHEEGYGVEVTSQLEYRHVKCLGFLPQEIEAGSPYLPEDFLQELVSDKVREIVLYNSNSLKALLEIGRSINHRQSIAVFFFASKTWTTFRFSPNS